MPVTGHYYFIARYYGPNSKMNGKTVHDILYKGTELPMYDIELVQ